MDKNLSMSNRLSFNRPIAESTLRASISSNVSPTFQWGCRKNLNSSTINKSIAKSPVRERSGLSKIDARIYTDVQSRGLSSRIVKYHDTLSSRMNRSNSMINLSSESKQYSGTRTSKPELTYKTGSKQNVSMTHIAPPSKSAFYGNTLSGLLRSSSVITLQHNDEDISSENRPIIHPPVTEKELQPTRSVLEVLKEISRKRINNEDTGQTDTSKKYCNRADGDVNPGSNGIQQQPPDFRNVHAHAQTPPTYKRLRESATEYRRIEQNDGYLSKLPPQPDHHQDVSPPEPQGPPKRRQCNYNNDITSSLSSSRKVNNKRKLFDHDGEGEKQQEKQIKYQSQIRLPELSNALSCVAKSPITALPKNTAHSSTTNGVPLTELSSPALPPPLAVPVQKSVSAPAESNIRQERQQQQQKEKSVPEKPKLRLFNKNYKVNEEGEDESGVEDSSALENVDDAYAGIQFVKPKKFASSIAGSASQMLMERTKKSKLALMLSGLRGELYLGDEEEPPAMETQQNKPTNDAAKIMNPISLPTSATDATTTASSSSSFTIQSSMNTNAQKSSNSSGTSAVDSSTPATRGFSIPLPTNKPTTATATSPTKISSPLTGIKLTPQTTTTTATTTTTTAATAPPSITFSGAAAAIPPAFSFGIASTTSTTNSVVNKPTSDSQPPTLQLSTNKTPNVAINVGQTTAAPNATSQPPQLLTSGGTAAATVQDKLPGFSMQQLPAAATASASIATSTPAAPFSFGLKPTTTTTAAAASVSSSAAQPPGITSATSAKPLFAFGMSTAQQSTNVTATTTTTTTTTATAPEAAAPFSFGANKTLSSGGFNFGVSAAPTTTAAPKIFNFATPKTTTASTGGFSFGTTTTTTTTTETKPQTANIFGKDVAAVTPNPTLKFGEQLQQQNAQQTPQGTTTTNNNAFMFGNKPPTNDTASQENAAAAAAANSAFNVNTFGSLSANSSSASKAFSFGGSKITTEPSTHQPTNASSPFNLTNNTANKPFSFGASAAAAAAANTTNSSAAAAAAPTANTFSLSNNNNNQNNNNQPTNLFNFGASNTHKNTPTEAVKPNNTFSFGNSAQSKPFSFGGGASAATEPPKSIFGTMNNTTATEAPKAPTNSFSFPSNNNTLNFGAGAGAVNKPNTSEPPKPVAQNNGATNAFSFRNNNKNNGAFGDAGPNAQNNVFSFSGNNNNNNSTPSNSATTTNTANPSFNAFTNNNNNQGNTFTFGGAAAVSSAATVPVKPIAFGMTNNNSTATAQSNTFVFGGGGGSNNNQAQAPSAPAAATAANLFAMPNNVNVNNNVTTTAFGGGGVANKPNTSLFSMPSPSSTDRVIKRATRRLTKS